MRLKNCNNRKAGGVIIAAIIALQGMAQTSRSLSVDELFRLGIENSTKIQASRINRTIAYENKETARSNRLPDIAVGLTAGYAGRPTLYTQGLSGATHPDLPNWKQNYNVELSQPLYQGGRIKYSLEKAVLEEQIAALNLERDAAELKLLLMSKYLDLLELYKQAEVLTHNIAESERRLHDIRQLKKEGMITENDVLRSELLLTNYRLFHTQAINNIAIVSQQLDVALGLDERLLLSPDTSLLEQFYPLDTYEAYVQQADGVYPELRIARIQKNVARKNVRLSKAAFLPALSFRAANTLGRPTSTQPASDIFMNNWNMSLVVSYNLSSLYHNRHEVKAAQQAISLQETNIEQEARAIRTGINSAYIKHGEAIERINTLTLSVKQANENFRIVQNKYFNKLAILTDLLDAANVRLDAELQLTSAKANMIYTYYQLLRSSGKL